MGSIFAFFYVYNYNTLTFFDIFRLIVEVFKDHPGLGGDDNQQQQGKKRKGGGKTVSSFYKDQLGNLMATLHATEPHFIR